MISDWCTLFCTPSILFLHLLQHNSSDCTRTLCSYSCSSTHSHRSQKPLSQPSHQTIQYQRIHTTHNTELVGVGCHHVTRLVVPKCRSFTGLFNGGWYPSQRRQNSTNVSTPTPTEGITDTRTGGTIDVPNTVSINHNSWREE